jgi:Na+/H+ antiporter NhaA
LNEPSVVAIDGSFRTFVLNLAIISDSETLIITRTFIGTELSYLKI